MEQNDLISELIRSALFGESDTRRNPESLKNIIRQSFLEKAETAIREAEAQIEQIKSWGKDAAGLAADGIEADSLEYENLMNRAGEVGNFARQYCANCFLRSRKTENETPDLSHLQEEIQQNSFCNASVIRQAFGKIKMYRTWLNDFDRTRDLKECLEQLKKIAPDRAAEAEQLLSNGEKISKLLQKAFGCGSRGAEKEFQELGSQARALGASALELKNLQKNFEKGVKKAAQFRKAPQTDLPHPLPDYDPDGAIPFFPGNLSPSPHWSIMVDETGSVFDESALEKNETKNGKFVAVLIPQNSDLPKIKAFHATENETEAVANVLDALLHTATPCGILGVTLEAMAKAPVNYWYNGLERLFALIFRLLPLEGETAVDIYVEARGSSEPQMVQRCIDCALYHFAQAFPERSKLLHLHVEHIEKKKSADPVFNAYNGYVDAVACVWGGKRPPLKKMLKNYGLVHHCLLEGEVQELYQVLDDLAQNNPIRPELWSVLISSSDRRHPDSLTNRVLNTLGNLVQKDTELWQTYLDFVVRHLNSKAIRLSVLGNQISFLKKYQPQEAVLLPRLQLLWLTAKLAEANHRGAVAVEAYELFRKLIVQLYDEDAPLCCWAALHLAVSFTNGYEFEKAGQVLEEFMQLNSAAEGASDMLKAVPGLQYYGQLISSMGQHAAFTGHYDTAVSRFQEAIQVFERLSNSHEAFEDIGQTSAYLLTVLMDQEKPDAGLFQNTLDFYFGKDLEHAAEVLSRSRDPRDKYRHHILLRLILTEKIPGNVRQFYLDQKEQWQDINDGHPWEMITFYRALLLQPGQERNTLLRKAYSYCAGADATLHIISAVILGSLLLDDPSVESEYRTLVERCIAEVPALEERGEILRSQITAKLAPLELAKQILPFNFR